jgi:hypothetical protein
MSGELRPKPTSRTAQEGKLMNTAEAKQTLGTSGLVLHRAALYDLTLWLLSLGRESAFREKVLRLARLLSGEQVLDARDSLGTKREPRKSMIRGSFVNTCRLFVPDERLAATL